MKWWWYQIAVILFKWTYLVKKKKSCSKSRKVQRSRTTNPVPHLFKCCSFSCPVPILLPLTTPNSCVFGGVYLPSTAWRTLNQMSCSPCEPQERASEAFVGSASQSLSLIHPVRARAHGISLVNQNSGFWDFESWVGWNIDWKHMGVQPYQRCHLEKLVQGLQLPWFSSWSLDRFSHCSQCSCSVCSRWHILLLVSKESQLIHIISIIFSVGTCPFLLP